MKKKVTKKLMLKRTTVADLNVGQMITLKGGGATDSCNSMCETCFCETVTCQTCIPELCDTGNCIPTDTEYSACDCLTVGFHCS